MVWDIERGQANQILPRTWQTDTCIGNWHYDQRVLDLHQYKTAKTVIHTLVDIVSKNGNLLLNIPVRGDGSIDADRTEDEPENEVRRGGSSSRRLIRYAQNG